MALTRKRFLIAKIESTYGTDPTPVGGTDAIQVTNLEVTPIESDNIQPVALQGFIGNSTRGTILANKRVSVTFDVELSGSGTAGTAPAYGSVLKACGLSETTVADTSVTYAPVSSTFDSVTIYCFYDGTRHKITGCRGSASFTLNAGELPTISFTMTGLYNAPDDTALSGDFTVANQAAALEVSDANITTNTFHGVTDACLESLSFALNNEFTFRPLMCSESVVMTNRAPGGNAVIEAPEVGTIDYFAKAVATATGSSVFTLGATGGNITTLNMPQTDITGVGYGDTNGVVNLSVDYLALPTTSGNDEFTLVYT